MWQARARTISTLTFLFVVPTILGILVFWTIWRFVRWLDLSQSTRRLLFVLIGTLTLAPMLIPAATIMTAWVPHGMLIVMGPTELPAYYVQLARYVVPSFAVTGLVFWVLARQWVGADRTRGQSIWLTLAAPLVVGLLIILTYRYAIPSNDIPAYLTHQSIEHAYGERLDEVRALVDIDDAQLRIPATQRLSSLFEADPVVLEVGLQVPTTNDPYNQTFYFLRGASPLHRSSYGASRPPDQQRLRRETWEYREGDPFVGECAKKFLGSIRNCRERNVLKYLRPITVADETLYIDIAFDYEGVNPAFEQ